MYLYYRIVIIYRNDVTLTIFRWLITRIAAKWSSIFEVAHGKGDFAINSFDQSNTHLVKFACWLSLIEWKFL